ncbi:Fluoroacetate dehalogenase [Pigmentiphaga humi]|uniref:Fluoroacetate dehalogenase n=1 Tax=Pigmentiphaga humi TaxID=2478468 RepID=A0A3P4B3F5_9BURK|nr:alpha/beta hydrolase [Pigmentiphaga humi]VCU70582.1 Fluoroacetate dehalogenase [Pigmentiphaga humi]
MSQPEHSTGCAPSGEVEIFYRRFGTPGATPLLIAHGLSYISYDWTGIAQELASDREVVAIDLRGFGESGRSPQRNYELRDFAGDIVAVLDHLQWPRAILAGHSMGGRICLCTAHWHPERVAALACLDFAPDVAAAGRRNVALRIGNQPDLFESVDQAMAYHGLPAGLPADAPERKRYEAFLKPVAGGYELKRDLHFRDNFRQTLQGKPAPAPAGLDLWAMVRELSMPALFVRGSRSDMFEAPTMDKLRQANPHARVEQIDASHDLAGDNPHDLARVLRAFIAPL